MKTIIGWERMPGKGILRILLWLTLLIGTAALPGRSQDLPEGKGKDIVQDVCSQCHSLRQVVSEKATHDEWKDLVDQMVANGAEIAPDDLATVVDYLATNFPKAAQKSEAPAADQKKQGEGAAKGDAATGKEIFSTNCAGCHDADSADAIVGPGLKGLFHWPAHKLSDGTEHKEHTPEIIRKQIVEGGGAMRPVGASLSAKELDDLIAYLQTL